MQFECDGQEMTVADYFEQRYHLRLKLPGAPCVPVALPDPLLY